MIEELEKIIIDGEVPSAEEMDKLRGEYPYFAGAEVLLLAWGSLTGERRKEAVSRVLCCIGDPEALRRISGAGDVDFDSFYPDMNPPTPSTYDTINTFLDTYGKESDRQTDALEKVIFSTEPSFDAAFLAGERGTVPDDETSRHIDTFLASQGAGEGVKKRTRRVGTPVENTGSGETVTNTPLTESLAKVMVKNGNYEKALEIISALSLDNPQKSAYFADQIRFLKKLIINQQYKK